MKKWGILGAMESEVKLLAAAMDDVKMTTYGGQNYYDGYLSGRPVTVVQCGIGKVWAALGAQILIDRFGAEMLWNTGIAGGTAPSIGCGDFVVSTNTVQHDFNLKAWGYVRGSLGGEDASRPTYYEADEHWRRVFCEKAALLFPQVKTHEGTIATGDIFIAENRLKEGLHRRYGALATEMEGAAVAQAAVLNEVPFVIVRAISDLADEDSPEAPDEFADRIAGYAAQLLIALSGDPDTL